MLWRGYLTKQYSLPFLARVESGYCQVAEEEEVSICRKAGAIAIPLALVSFNASHSG